MYHIKVIGKNCFKFYIIINYPKNSYLNIYFNASFYYLALQIL